MTQPAFLHVLLNLMARPRNAGGLSRRSGNTGSLGRQLDREIYASIRTYLDDLEDKQQLENASVSVATVYQHIKRSNSSLARRPKAALEDSIERILESIKDESDSDSDSAPNSGTDTRSAAARATNSMNRRMVQNWNLANPGSGKQSPNTRNPPSADDAGQTSPSTKRAASNQSLKVNGANPHSSKKVARRPGTDATSSMSAPKHVSFDDLGGMYSTIELFQELVLLPLYHPAHYVERGLKIPRGILLHGPPGCGKTMLCEAIAAELELPFLSISAPSVVSGMSGESEKALRSHFERAIEAAPCLMFIDEIDAITPKRESAQREMERRIVAQLLTCMDGLDMSKTGSKPVIVLAATNRPDSLDPALRRAGRFDTEINIGVPDASMRARILQAQTRKTKLGTDVDFAELAQKTPGFVGADLESLVYRAGSVSNKRYIKVCMTNPFASMEVAPCCRAYPSRGCSAKVFLQSQLAKTFVNRHYMTSPHKGRRPTMSTCIIQKQLPK